MEEDPINFYIFGIASAFTLTACVFCVAYRPITRFMKWSAEEDPEKNIV